MKYIEVEKIKIPYWEIISKKEGPSILICAEQHGNEVNGSEVIRRFYEIIKDRIVKGKVYLIPFMNLPALYNRRPHIDSKVGQPYKEGENMNLKWPGKEDGSLIEKIVYKINKEIVEKCDYCIDLHSWGHLYAPAILPTKGDEKGLEIAKISGIKFILLKEVEKKLPTILSAYFTFTNRIGISVEFSGQYQIVEEEIKLEIEALKNICKFIGVIKGKIEKNKEIVIFDKKEIYDVKANTKGLLIKRKKLKLGDYIKKGELLSEIFSEETLNITKIYSPVSGYLFAYGSLRKNIDVDISDLHPFVEKEDIIAKIVCK